MQLTIVSLNVFICILDVSHMLLYIFSCLHLSLFPYVAVLKLVNYLGVVTYSQQFHLISDNLTKKTKERKKKPFDSSIDGTTRDGCYTVTIKITVLFPLCLISNK